MRRESLTQQLDRWTAAPMFWLSFAFLLLLAGALQEARGGETWPEGSSWCLPVLALLYPVFALELLVHLVLRSPQWKQHLLHALLPPLRIGGRDHRTGRLMWLPGLGWRRIRRDLFKRLQSQFNVPMIVIALLVLPLLAAEHHWENEIENHFSLRLARDTATSVIWIAFTIEFILMASVVDKKLRYCKTHWVDLVVICLPMIAFLRMARLGQLARLQRLSKLSRVYRLRGVTMRMFRGLLLLEVVQRLLSLNPQRRLLKLREQLEEKELEVAELRSEIRELEKRIAAQPSRRRQPSKQQLTATALGQEAD